MDANGTAWKNRPGGFCKCRAVKILVLFLSASYNKRKEDDMEKGKYPIIANGELYVEPISKKMNFPPKEWPHDYNDAKINISSLSSILSLFATIVRY